jgi:hypothetical protein
MLEKKYVIGIAVVLLACSASSWFAMRGGTPTPTPYVSPRVVAQQQRRVVKKDTARSKPTAAPAPTSSPVASQVVYTDYVGSVLAPLPPAPPPVIGNVVLPPSFVIVPGANVPGVTGLTRDRVTTYLATTFPRLVVRAVPYGSAVMYEPRTDRVTVSYDLNTNRVISARIG